MLRDGWEIGSVHPFMAAVYFCCHVSASLRLYKPTPKPRWPWHQLVTAGHFGQHVRGCLHEKTNSKKENCKPLVRFGHYVTTLGTHQNSSDRVRLSCRWWDDSWLSFIKMSSRTLNPAVSSLEVLSPLEGTFTGCLEGPFTGTDKHAAGCTLHLAAPPPLWCQKNPPACSNPWTFHVTFCSKWTAWPQNMWQQRGNRGQWPHLLLPRPWTPAAPAQFHIMEPAGILITRTTMLTFNKLKDSHGWNDTLPLHDIVHDRMSFILQSILWFIFHGYAECLSASWGGLRQNLHARGECRWRDLSFCQESFTACLSNDARQNCDTQIKGNSSAQK